MKYVIDIGNDILERYSKNCTSKVYVYTDDEDR